jgi:hypothetical protein
MYLKLYVALVGDLRSTLKRTARQIETEDCLNACIMIAIKSLRKLGIYSII